MWAIATASRPLATGRRLRNMQPETMIHDGANGGIADAELYGQSDAALSVSTPQADSANGISCQSCPTATLAARSAAVIISVLHVVPVGADVEMRRINAADIRTVRAAMPDQPAEWDRPTEVFVRPATSPDTAPADTQNRIAFIAARERPCPQPTMMKTAVCRAGVEPEARFRGLHGSAAPFAAFGSGQDFALPASPVLVVACTKSAYSGGPAALADRACACRLKAHIEPPTRSARAAACYKHVRRFYFSRNDDRQSPNRDRA